MRRILLKLLRRRQLDYAASRRTREIGIRIAVGASRWTITRLVLGEAVWLVTVGAVVGLAVTVLLTRPLAAFLVPGLSPSDPMSYAAVLLILAVADVPRGTEGATSNAATRDAGAAECSGTDPRACHLSLAWSACGVALPWSA